MFPIVPSIDHTGHWAACSPLTEMHCWGSLEYVSVRRESWTGTVAAWGVWSCPEIPRAHRTRPLGVWAAPDCLCSPAHKAKRCPPQKSSTGYYYLLSQHKERHLWYNKGHGCLFAFALFYHKYCYGGTKAMSVSSLKYLDCSFFPFFLMACQFSLKFTLGNWRPKWLFKADRSPGKRHEGSSLKRICSICHPTQVMPALGVVPWQLGQTFYL